MLLVVLILALLAGAAASSFSKHGMYPSIYIYEFFAIRFVACFALERLLY